MNLEEKALNFFALLEENYYIKRNLSNIQNSLSDNITWIGTGINEVCSSLSDAIEALTAEVKEYSGTFTISDSDVNYVALSEDLCYLFGSLIVTPISSEIAEENLRFSVILRDGGDEMKVEHVHFSHPDLLQDEHSYFTPKSRLDNHCNLQERVDSRRRQLELLTKNIPGGAHECKDDAGLTLISMSDGFLSLVGYSREEINTLFDNKFINLIYPEDRASVIAAIQKSICNGDEDSEIEYRIYHKSGKPIWILDKCRYIKTDHCSSFYCILIEITDRKQEQEDLRLSLERYQVVINQTTDIIFEWDVLSDTLSFSNNFYKKFGYIAISKDISQKLVMSDNIHNTDIQSLTTIMRQCLAGIPFTETELRLKNNKNEYIWCKIRATTQFNNYKQPIKVIGIIVDINDDKKQKEKLLNQAQHDPLTGIYNKVAINSIIDSCIKDNSNGVNQAMFILDIDFFKNINDTYGHLTGDRVLSEVARALKNSTRSSDYIGRIGGDEFVVFLPEVISENAAVKKAEKILEQLNQLRPFKNEMNLTASIGIAMTSSSDDSFVNLYENADKALYAQKNNGRNGYTLYNENFHKNSSIQAFNIKNYTDDNFTENHVVDFGLAQYCFRTLFNADSFDSVISDLLEIIGRSFDVSRTYIYETLEDNKHTSMIYEWCNDGIEPQVNKLQNFDYDEDLGGFRDNFDKDGLFKWSLKDETNNNLEEVLSYQDIKSMLHCAIMYKGIFLGGIGFDECVHDDREWAKTQISTFKLTANVISTFFIQDRLNKKVEKLLSKV